ncbi:deazaflavin-dependent oxidoreductase (nitroreductase family) [Nocardioides albertanoniae]|uniref:Deazaflavin-dependent oxidoreductase (Nitroreductase family) n=1 Tax=Nocardioides albertanoniae TaxID=1175486 RepID=A0A543ADQ8_9ACTN|nr:nitroreductase family deazaflavin-dependent oxidoreductase [Nocardioides albertanoniae]TQL70708.1 deazaflavin-dependent oxidoreductase (nitroreductase family) [Nocardioides albertanoniae]
MSFDTHNGTRGAKQPSAGLFLKLVNKLMMSRARKKDATMAGMRLLVLTTIGKKSGEPRSTPLAWFPGDDGTWLIAASAGGGAKNPAWYYNLAANPDRVTIELGGETIAVTAEQLHGEQRSRAWAAIVDSAANFGGYEEKTDREIPVIRLARA